MTGPSTVDGHTCAVITNIDEQSGDIAMGVDKSPEAKESGDSALDNGAGDRGMMFGYACDETPEPMPLAISGPRRWPSARRRSVRKSWRITCALDGKTQVTVEYDENGKPTRVDAVVVSTSACRRGISDRDPPGYDRTGHQAHGSR